MLEQPRCFVEGYVYIDPETEKWRIKEDAPDWAKTEFEEFQKNVNPLPDENGMVTVPQEVLETILKG